MRVQALFLVCLELSKKDEGQVKEDRILDAVLETFLVSLSPSGGGNNIYHIYFNTDED